jgi:hypothetical protein
MSTPTLVPTSYQYNPNDEYVFYPEPLSRQNSFQDLVEPPSIENPEAKVKIFDPRVRKQLTKLRPQYPWFLGFVTLIQIGMMVFSMVLNLKSTGSLIQMNPFNYLIGPGSGVEFH